jgi:8-oxo-dGTP pyrophosphatase MutT (NUDIX family)
MPAKNASGHQMSCAIAWQILAKPSLPLRSFRIAKIRPRKQYAALPLSKHEGRTMVMLITSRETRRWVLPKGNPEKGLAPHVVAAKEAYEEAGLVGAVMREAIGTYRYQKRLSGTKVVPCEVKVFPFAVEQQLDDWPEREQRDTRWFTPVEAARLVEESSLAELLLALTVEQS